MNVVCVSVSTSADMCQMLVKEWDAVPQQYVNKLGMKHEDRVPVCCVCVDLLHATEASVC